MQSNRRASRLSFADTWITDCFPSIYFFDGRDCLNIRQHYVLSFGARHHSCASFRFNPDISFTENTELVQVTVKHEESSLINGFMIEFIYIYKSLRTTVAQLHKIGPHIWA
jgi:hypothetical protein